MSRCSTGPGATKRDLVDYLDAVSGLILPELRGRPLSVVRVRAGQQPFMQKNLPDYAPPWIGSVTLWAESSRREVRYALCDDRRTLLWLANQRAVEYHPTLSLAGDLGRPSHLVLDIDPPPGGPFGQAVAAAHLIGQALAGAGLAGAVKTSGSKGLHIYVPVRASAEEAAAATRAIATRAARLDPALATTAFIKEDREGKVFLDSTRAFGATVAAAYSPRVRPGVPSRSRSAGTTWTPWRRATSPCTACRRCWAGTPRGRASCPRRSCCPRSWWRRDGRSRSPGCRPCTRASGASGPGRRSKPGA